MSPGNPTEDQYAKAATALGMEPASPTPEVRRADGEIIAWAQGGLTKRELFAAMAMQSYIVARGNQVCAPPPITTAERAVEYADALLKELSR